MKMTEPGVLAGTEVNVVIRAGDCSVTLLPAFGGKIASITIKDHELLQQPLAPIAPRTRTMPFDESDASGWDECLPSVAACSVSYAGGQARIPDHGDLWRAEWSEQGAAIGSQAERAVMLRADCFSLPLRLERSVALAETPEGWRIRADYTLTNTGKAEAPWSWAAHPLFAAAAGDRIVLPESVRTLRLEGSGGNRLGTAGDTVSWPIARLADGAESDLSSAQPIASGIGDKLFAGPLTGDENWCVLERPSAGVRIRMSFDTAATPYLGLWLCYGGWPEKPGPRQMCVAPEPSTAPVDSLAQSGPWSRFLKPGESFKWAMSVDFELI